MASFSRWIRLAGSALLPLLGSACTLTRAGYSSAPYSVLQRSGPVEFRHYSQIRVAQTPTAPESMGRDGSFMRLFRFISRGNADARKIPMTTPVLFRGQTGNATLAFVLPSDMDTVPAPLQSDVQIETIPEGTYATLRVSKRGPESLSPTALSQLREAVQSAGMRTVGNPEHAAYDPPWIPSFWQRNEIRWRVASASSTPASPRH